MLHSVFKALLGVYDIKTTESNPLETAPGCMPILEYRWYGRGDQLSGKVVQEHLS